ncbi:MAG: KGK domain-containing protein [Cuspidothrix sp.]
MDSIKSRRLPSIGDSKNWINKGVNYHILKPSKNWQSGKFRIKVTLEFCSDEPEVKEPESPLDDLRRKTNQPKS